MNIIEGLFAIVATFEIFCWKYANKFYLPLECHALQLSLFLVGGVACATILKHVIYVLITHL